MGCNLERLISYLDGVNYLGTKHMFVLNENAFRSKGYRKKTWMDEAPQKVKERFYVRKAQ